MERVSTLYLLHFGEGLDLRERRGILDYARGRREALTEHAVESGHEDYILSITEEWMFQYKPSEGLPSQQLFLPKDPITYGPKTLLVHENWENREKEAYINEIYRLAEKAEGRNPLDFSNGCTGKCLGIERHRVTFDYLIKGFEETIALLDSEERASEMWLRLTVEMVEAREKDEAKERGSSSPY